MFFRMQDFDFAQILHTQMLLKFSQILTKFAQIHVKHIGRLWLQVLGVWL